MTITAAIVLFAMIWFLTLFVALPFSVRTQAEEGHVVRGTPSSAPAELRLRRIFLRVTVAAVAIWVLVAAMILWGPIGVTDLDFWGRMEPVRR